MTYVYTEHVNFSETEVTVAKVDHWKRSEVEHVTFVLQLCSCNALDFLCVMSETKHIIYCSYVAAMLSIFCV